MHSPSESRILYESKLSIFNGRLCAICISAISHSTEFVKLRVTSSSDASILLDKLLEPSVADKLGETLKKISDARSQDPGILGPRVDSNSDDVAHPFRLIVESGEEEVLSVPLSVSSPQEHADYVLGLYAKEKAQHHAQIEKTKEIAKQLERKTVEYNAVCSVHLSYFH
uniref:Uncharacterized protein n=1 Tax=Caenorhabditis japonica TaxID=281687 RepID=A0A8R1E9C0_CAEJA